MTGDGDGFDIDDSDYDIYIEEVNVKISLCHFHFLYSLDIVKCPVLSGSLISDVKCLRYSDTVTSHSFSFFEFFFFTEDDFFASDLYLERY